MPVECRFHRRRHGGQHFGARETVKEFIDLATAKPGELTYGSSGPGSNKHLGGELFKLMTGTDILHVAYKGSTGARND